MSDALADTQAEADGRGIPIGHAGIRGLRYPAVVPGCDGDCPTIVTVDMSVSVPSDRRGAHMSRLVQALHRWERRITPENCRAFLDGITRLLDAEEAHIRLAFVYFRTKRAPVSRSEGMLDYHVTMTVCGSPRHWGSALRVMVPVTSLCPCSRAISRYGAHNQRSNATVTVPLFAGPWIDDLIDLVELEASAELFSVVKRTDEKFLTERAYEAPKFAEDLARDVAARLSSTWRIADYRVEIENFESIHNHSAFAIVEFPGGGGPLHL